MDTKLFRLIGVERVGQVCIDHSGFGEHAFAMNKIAAYAGLAGARGLKGFESLKLDQ